MGDSMSTAELIPLEDRNGREDTNEDKGWEEETPLDGEIDNTRNEFTQSESEPVPTNENAIPTSIETLSGARMEAFAARNFSNQALRQRLADANQDILDTNKALDALRQVK